MAREGRGASEHTHAILILVYCCGCSIQILVTDSFLSVPNLKIKLYPGFLLMIEMWSIHTVGGSGCSFPGCLGPTIPLLDQSV